MLCSNVEIAVCSWFGFNFYTVVREQLLIQMNTTTSTLLFTSIVSTSTVHTCLSLSDYKLNKLADISVGDRCLDGWTFEFRIFTHYSHTPWEFFYKLLFFHLSTRRKKSIQKALTYVFEKKVNGQLLFVKYAALSF